MPGSVFFVNKNQYRSRKSKKINASPANSKPKSQPKQWNDYLTDNSKYKLTDEELRKKKESITSPNNILYSPHKVSTRGALSIASPMKLVSRFDLVQSPRVKPVKQHLSLRKQSPSASKSPVDMFRDIDQEDQNDDKFYNLSFDSASRSPSQDDAKKTKFISRVSSEKSIGVVNIDTSEDKTTEDKFYQEIAQQVEFLLGELRHYEQLSGRRSCFDAEELELNFSQQFSAAKGSSLRTAVVLKFLTQLTSQSMSYLLQSHIQIQNQKILNMTLSAQLAQMESPLSQASTNSGQVQTVSTEASPSTVAVPEVTKANVGNSPFTDIESPHGHASQSKLPVHEGSADIISSATRTPEFNRHRSKSPARTPNGTSASDWLFSHPAVSGASTTLLASLATPTSRLLSSSPPSENKLMVYEAETKVLAQIQRGLFPQSPSSTEKAPERRNRYVPEEEFIEIDSFTPMTSMALKAPRKVNNVERTYDAFTQSKPLTREHSAVGMQETPSMIFPRAVAPPTPLAPSKHLVSGPYVSPRPDHRKLFDSAR